MIACLYGTSAAPFVASAVEDLCRACAQRRLEVRPLTIEQAIAERPAGIADLYVFPFETPDNLPEALPATPAELLRALFPRAAFFNNLAAHELCSDKVAATQRLLERGLAIPETLMTSSARDAVAFIRTNSNAILKQSRSSASGHLIVMCDASGTVVGEARGRRYVLELMDSGLERRLEHGILSCPPPFFLQRLITTTRRDGVLAPAQVLRAYVVDGTVTFWTELSRRRAQRPSDFIVGPHSDARLRFLQVVSHAADQAAKRAADALGVRFGAVDLIRSDHEGPYVLGAVTDGPNGMVDRHFKGIPDFRSPFDFDQQIAEAIHAEMRSRTAPTKRTR